MRHKETEVHALEQALKSAGSLKAQAEQAVQQAEDFHFPVVAKCITGFSKAILFTHCVCIIKLRLFLALHNTYIVCASSVFSHTLSTHLILTKVFVAMRNEMSRSSWRCRR